MSKRTTKRMISGVTPEQFTTAMSSYAATDAALCSMMALMDTELTRIRDKYADELDDLRRSSDAHLEVIQAYCTEQKNTLFGQRRSLDTVHGKVGFRLGTPKLKTLPKHTWDRVLDKLRTIMPGYVRIKEEVDKERLIATRYDEQLAPHLNAIGVYVDQDELFFIELKKEESKN